MDTNTNNKVDSVVNLEELKSSIREISNVNVSDEVFISKSKEFLESKELEESKKKVIEEYIGRILENRIENRKIIEDKNNNTLDIEEWHSELRARLEVRYNEELERIKNREKNKKLSLDIEKKRKLEKEEYNTSISKYLGEDVYKELVGTLRFTSGGLLDSRDPINYDIITQHDKYIQEHIMFNEFTNDVEMDGKTITNNDLLTITSHFSRIYGIHNDTRIINAVTNPNNLHSYHPIKDIIEYKKWDGEERIDKFFKEICNVEIKNKDDEIYYREVARMLFFGGIKRLYEPGSKFDYMLIFEGRQGCVDCDTEYFNGKEWHKISEYQHGDKVLSYYPDGHAELVTPERYIKQHAEYLWHFKTHYGLDQCVSDNHDIVYITSKGNINKKSMSDVIKQHENSKNGFSGRFITAFNYSGNGIDLSDDEIRLMIAIFADGNIMRNQIRFNLKKERKINRLKLLLDKCGVEYKIKVNNKTGYTVIYAKYKIVEKHFTDDWYNCSYYQFQIIADEVMLWDGAINDNPNLKGEHQKPNSYSTTCKKDADFIQFVFNSLGYYASIYTFDRRGEIIDGYVRKSIDYVVRYSKEYLKTMSKNTIIEKYETHDGFEYCFTVPSHMLILRRNNCVFITGNCGKSTLARLLALSDIAYSEVTTIEGQAGIENVQGSWICEFAELLAMVRTRDIEAIKAFITRQYDKYRPAYARVIETFPRQCVFIGTTNDSEFLKDSTGNRRYLPVAINTNVKYLFSHLEDVQKYILECWREAFYKYLNNEIYLTIPSKYDKIVEKKRTIYTDDDPIEGIIMAYCESKEVGYELCGMEIYTKCMNGLRKNYGTMDSRNIARVMKKLNNWERMDDRKYFQDFGQQRYWRKMYDDSEDNDDIDEDDL